MTEDRRKLKHVDTALIDEVGRVVQEFGDGSPVEEMNLRLLSSIYTSQNAIIDRLEIQNGRIEKGEGAIALLEKRNIVSWVLNNKGLAFLTVMVVFAANSMINWQGIRRPLIQALLRTFGIDFDLEAIP
jgi:hypothetical protein